MSFQTGTTALTTPDTTPLPRRRRTLIATIGLPACGKSTRAMRWVAEDPAGRARVGTDQIAAMIRPPLPYDEIEARGLGLHVDMTEQAAVHGTIEGLLRAGIDVVCDDTHLLPRHLAALRDLAQRCRADLQIWDMTHIDVPTCITRDQQRAHAGGRSVGADTIRAKWQLWRAHQPRGRTPQWLREWDRTTVPLLRPPISHERWRLSLAEPPVPPPRPPHPTTTPEDRLHTEEQR